MLTRILTRSLNNTPAVTSFFVATSTTLRSDGSLISPRLATGLIRKFDRDVSCGGVPAEPGACAPEETHELAPSATDKRNRAKFPHENGCYQSTDECKGPGTGVVGQFEMEGDGHIADGAVKGG